LSRGRLGASRAGWPKGGLVSGPAGPNRVWWRGATVEPLSLPPPSDWTDYSRWSPLDRPKLALVRAGSECRDSPMALSQAGRLGAREAQVGVILLPRAALTET
jgi:hypothetical protein